MGAARPMNGQHDLSCILVDSPLRQRMIDQMRIANLAESTQIAYLFEIERLAKHYGTSPADLDGEQLRDWILKLIDRGLSPSSTNSTLAAFRFFYVETLGCPKRVAGLRNRKKPQALPRYMTEQEVERLILATPDLRHRAAFIAAYDAGLRVGGRRPRRLEPHRDLVHRLIGETPHLTIDRLQDLLSAAGIAVCRDTIWRFLRREGLSFKKGSIRESNASPCYGGGEAGPVIGAGARPTRWNQLR